MKTLIITGASKGIGFQVAKMAAEKSYRVINISRSDAAHASIENHNIDLAAPDAADKFSLLVEELQIDGHITTGP